MAPWDGQDLLPLWVAAWAATFPDIDFPGRAAWFRAELERLVADGALVLGALAGTEMCGFVTVHQRTGMLDQLAVDPACSGCGIGTALLDAAKAAGPGWLALEVNQGNARAVQFYARAGFVTLGEGSNSRSGLATWRLRWDLNAPADTPTLRL